MPKGRGPPRYLHPIDDIDCALSVLGYVLVRDRDPKTQCLRYAVDVDGVTASTGIVSSGD